MTEQPFASRLRSVALPFTVLRGLGQALEFAGWIVLARKLGTHGFGSVSIFFLVCRYGGLVADWGASYRGSRDVAAGWHGSVTFLLRRRTLLAAVLGSGAGALATAMGYGRLAPLALVVVGLGLNRDWLALGRAQGVRAGLPTVVQGAVIALGAAFVASDGGAAWVIGWGYALAAILSVLANRPEPGDSDHDEELRTDGWMLVAVLAAQVTSTFDILLLGVFIGASDAGIYAAVYRIPNAIMALLSMIFAGFLPLATDLRVRARGQYRKLIRRSLRVSGRCALALALCSPIAAIFVPFVYGDAYARGEIPLMILLAATAIATGAAPLHSFAQATARDRAYALILICAAVVNLGGNLALIPIGGMIAAASVTLATQVTLAVLLARFVWSDQRLGLHDLASR